MTDEPPLNAPGDQVMPIWVAVVTAWLTARLTGESGALAAWIAVAIDGELSPAKLTAVTLKL